MIEIASKREMCPNKRLYSTQNSKWVENKTVNATSTYSASRCTYYSDFSCLFLCSGERPFPSGTQCSLLALCVIACATQRPVQLHYQVAACIMKSLTYFELFDRSRPLFLKPSFSETLAPYSLFFLPEGWRSSACQRIAKTNKNKITYQNWAARCKTIRIPVQKKPWNMFVTRAILCAKYFLLLTFKFLE